MSEDTSPEISTTAACRLLEIHPDTLLRWEREGKIASLPREDRAHRRWRLDDVQRLALARAS